MILILGIVFVVLGYLCGSLAPALVVSRLLNVPDPREEDSGGPGATEIPELRAKIAEALFVTGDVLKGAIPVFLAHLFSPWPAVAALTAIAALVGHMFPVFFRFQGAKDVVAATFGAVIGLVWPVALLMGAVWVLTAMLSRHASLASMIAAVIAPVFALVFIREPATILALMVIAALVVFAHRANIARLMSGTEPETNF